MAELAFHAAQLRSVGLSAQEAFAVANVAAGQTSSIDTTKAKQFNGSAGEANGDSTQIRISGYALLELALQKPANYANDRMLLEVADSYRRRIVTVSDWWIHWLMYGVQLMVMACVFFMVVSMFMPLISIVSGLTGN